MLARASLIFFGFILLAYLLLHTSTLHAKYEQLAGARKSTSEASKDQYANDNADTVKAKNEQKATDFLPTISSPTSAPSTLSTVVTSAGTPSPSYSGQDKIVVIGRLQHEDTDWVAQFLPE